MPPSRNLKNRTAASSASPAARSWQHRALAWQTHTAPMAAPTPARPRLDHLRRPPRPQPLRLPRSLPAPTPPGHPPDHAASQHPTPTLPPPPRPTPPSTPHQAPPSSQTVSSEECFLFARSFRRHVHPQSSPRCGRVGEEKIFVLPQVVLESGAHTTSTSKINMSHQT